MTNTSGLMPPWPKGSSGNPSGLCKDGSSPQARRIELELKRQLYDKPNGARQLVRRWIAHANKGSARHLELLLERLEPLVKGNEPALQVLQGIRLELEGGELKRLTIQGSVAVESAEESQMGPATARVDHPDTHASELPLLSMEESPREVLLESSDPSRDESKGD